MQPPCKRGISQHRPTDKRGASDSLQWILQSKSNFTGGSLKNKQVRGRKKKGRGLLVSSLGSVSLVPNDGAASSPPPPGHNKDNRGLTCDASSHYLGRGQSISRPAGRDGRTLLAPSVSVFNYTSLLLLFSLTGCWLKASISSVSGPQGSRPSMGNKEKRKTNIKKKKNQSASPHPTLCDGEREDRGKPAQEEKKKAGKEGSFVFFTALRKSELRFSPRCGPFQKLKLGASGFALNKVPVVFMGVMVFGVAQVGRSGCFHGAAYSESLQCSPPLRPSAPPTTLLPPYPSPIADIQTSSAAKLGKKKLQDKKRSLRLKIHQQQQQQETKKKKENPTHV